MRLKLSSRSSHLSIWHFTGSFSYDEFLNYFVVSHNAFIKRVDVQRNFQVSRSFTKTTKHGNITLALPSSIFWMDLTVHMDIHGNPGPDKDEIKLKDLASFCNTSLTPRTKEFITYSRKQLLDLRSKYFVPDSTFHLLKDLNILKTRSRAGVFIQNNINHIPVRLSEQRSNDALSGKSCLINL